MSDELRGELAQAIMLGTTQWAHTEDMPLAFEQAAADAVLVLVEQRIAEARADERRQMIENGWFHTKNADDLHYREMLKHAGAVAERERIAAKIKALPGEPAYPNDDVVHRDDVLRVVRGDE